MQTTERISEWMARVEIYCLLTLVFILPISRQYTSLIIFLWFFALFVHGVIDKSLLSEFRSSFNYYWLLLPGLFFLYGISLLYSQHLSVGIAKLETKLALLVVPILIGFSKKTIKKYFKYFLLSFILGCTIAALYCFYHAMKLSVSIQETGILFDPRLNKAISISESFKTG